MAEISVPPPGPGGARQRLLPGSFPGKRVRLIMGKGGMARFLPGGHIRLGVLAIEDRKEGAEVAPQKWKNPSWRHRTFWKERP